MTTVPAVSAVISLTPDGSEDRKENGKLIYRNLHPRNPIQQQAGRLEKWQACASCRPPVGWRHSNQQMRHYFTALHRC